MAQFPRLLISLLLLIITNGIQAASPEINQDKWIPNESDLRIFEVRVGPYTFEDVVGAYKYQDVVLLPLGGLSEMLDIAITVKPGFAEGFVIREERTLILDVSRHEIIIEGQPHRYDPDKLHQLDDDIYIESNLLAEWLFMTLDVDLFGSRIWVRSDEKLPFLKRKEREERIARTRSLLDARSEYFPRHYEPYNDWSVPFIDQTFRMGQLWDAEGQSSTTYQYTTYATADLMKLESAWYLSGDDQDEIDEFRATFGRKDPEGGLLGFMQANEYAFGHVVEPRVALITAPGSLEPGVTVSNYPIGRQAEYDRHRFRGDLLPNWEVELYQNNALIGYQQTAVDGQYDFQDIPLLFGSNHFRLVFYGPQGQIREEEKYFELSQSLTQQGKHYYRMTSTTDEVDGSRTTAQYDYGLSKNVSSSFNLASIPLQEGIDRKQHTYLKAGVRGFWDALFVSLDAVDDTESGSAIELGLQTRYGSTIFGFNDAYLSEFFSEEFRPSELELSRRSRFRIDTSIPPSFLPRIPVSFEFRRDEFATGAELFEIINQISTNARGIAISNLLTRQKLTDQPATMNGTLQLSTNINLVRLRSALSYTMEPESELTNVSITLDPGQYRNYHLTFGINHSLDQDVTEYSASANKVSGRYNLSFGARYNTNDEFNLDLSLSVGFGYEPRRDLWESDARTMASHGSVSARVFLDSNQNGLYDETDESLQDVGFRLNGGYNNARTDKDGIVFLTGLPAHQPANLVIAPETMVDPLWTAALDGVRIVPRPGQAIQLDFPVFISGEIDGTVYLERDTGAYGVGRVSLELVDDFGRVIKTTETAYDGFYVISKIPLGQYRLRVASKQLDELNLTSTGEEMIEINSEKQFLNGIDFKLKPGQKPGLNNN